MMINSKHFSDFRTKVFLLKGNKLDASSGEAPSYSVAASDSATYPKSCDLYELYSATKNLVLFKRKVQYLSEITARLTHST